MLTLLLAPAEPAFLNPNPLVPAPLPGLPAAPPAPEEEEPGAPTPTAPAASPKSGASTALAKISPKPNMTPFTNGSPRLIARLALINASLRLQGMPVPKIARVMLPLGDWAEVGESSGGAGALEEVEERREGELEREGEGEV